MRCRRLVIGIVVGLAAQGTLPLRAHAVEHSVEDVTARLMALFAEPGPESAALLRARVDAGVPPGALLVLLDGQRAAPRADIMDVVQTLAGYRRVEVRARALAAWAASGGQDAVEAITRAADDTDPTIRRLAVALAAVHPSARADEIVAALLRDDPELAALLAADGAAGVPSDPRPEEQR